jgi:hypothetical protein
MAKSISVKKAGSKSAKVGAKAMLKVTGTGKKVVANGRDDLTRRSAVTKVKVKKASASLRNKIEIDKNGRIRKGVGKAAGGSGRAGG